MAVTKCPLPALSDIPRIRSGTPRLIVVSCLVVVILPSSMRARLLASAAISGVIGRLSGALLPSKLCGQHNWTNV